MRKCSILPVVLVLGFTSFDVFGAVVARSVKTTSVKTAGESFNNKFILGNKFDSFGLSKKSEQKDVGVQNADNKNIKSLSGKLGIGQKSSFQKRNNQSTANNNASSSGGDCGYAVLGREITEGAYNYILNNTDLDDKMISVNGSGYWAGGKVAAVQAVKSQYATHTGGCVCPSYSFRYLGKKAHFYTWAVTDGLKDINAQNDGVSINKNFACLIDTKRLDESYKIKFVFGCNASAKLNSDNEVRSILHDAPKISTNDNKTDKTVASVCPAISGTTVWQCKTILDGAQHSFILDPSKSYKDNTSLRDYINKYGRSDWELAATGQQWYGDNCESEMIVTYCTPNSNTGVANSGTTSSSQNQGSQSTSNANGSIGSANNKADTGTQKQNSQSTSNANGSIGSASNKAKFDAQICSWRPDHYVREKGSANLRHKKITQEGCDGMSKGTWWTRYDNQLYEGASLCSSVNSGQPTSSDPSGYYCWCKLSPYNEWVYLENDDTSNGKTNNDWYCVAACAEQCEFWAHDSEVRARLSGKVKVPAGTSVLDSIPQYTLSMTYSCEDKGTTHKTMGKYTRAKLYEYIQTGYDFNTGVDRHCLVGNNKLWQCSSGAYSFELVPKTEYASNKSFVDYLLSPNTPKSNMNFNCVPAGENKQNMYTVTLDTNGGELQDYLESTNGVKYGDAKTWKAIGSNKYTKSYVSGENVYGPEARRGDEVFIAWCLDKDTLNDCPSGSLKIGSEGGRLVTSNLNGNKTFYAKYKKADFFAAMYNSLGWCWKRTYARSGGWVEDTCGDMKKGSWWVKRNGKTYEGTTKCSVTEGKQNTMGKPSDTEGKNCWCKEAKASSWISSGHSSGNAEACNKWCPQECSYLSW